MSRKTPYNTSKIKNLKIISSPTSSNKTNKEMNTKTRSNIHCSTLNNNNNILTTFNNIKHNTHNLNSFNNNNNNMKNGASTASYFSHKTHQPPTPKLHSQTFQNWKNFPSTSSKRAYDWDTHKRTLERLWGSCTVMYSRKQPCVASRRYS